MASVYAVAGESSVNFSAYFGGLKPVIATALVSGAGIAAFYALYRFRGFAVCEATAFGRGVRAAMLLALPFMVTVTVADILLGFPPDITVPLPAALVFYPIMGFIAQMALHVIPFALVLSAATRFSRKYRSSGDSAARSCWYRPSSPCSR